uniref:Uncharacterized protein n=1 Tax=Saccharomyces cerevisiae TaxID=4932 RepID=A0A0H3WHI7_YEASX|nr:hypothetical protein [Saccharomyces cerevisiae]
MVGVPIIIFNNNWDPNFFLFISFGRTPSGSAPRGGPDYYYIMLFNLLLFLIYIYFMSLIMLFMHYLYYMINYFMIIMYWLYYKIYTMCATYLFNITVIITHPTLRTRGPGFVRNRDLYIYKSKM